VTARSARGTRFAATARRVVHTRHPLAPGRWHAALLALVLAAGTATPAAAADERLECLTGPLRMTVGGTPWDVNSCSDGRSLVLIATDDNPAAPYHFLVRPRGSAVSVAGQGNGNAAAAAPARAELEALNATRLDLVVRKTRP